MRVDIKKTFLQNHRMIVILLGLLYLSTIDFELFHYAVQTMGIVIGVMIVTIFHHSKQCNLHNNQFGILGIGYISIILFIFLHMITKNNMPFFDMNSDNLSLQFYSVAKYMNVITLLLFVMNYPKKLNMKVVCVICFSISILLFLSILRWSNYLVVYTEAFGPTSFKKASIFFTSVGLICTVIILVKKKDQFHPNTFTYLLYCLIFVFFTNITFTLFKETGEDMTVISDFFQTVSFYCIYKAIVQVNMTIPLKILQESREKYENLVQLLPEAIFVHSKGKIVLANPVGLSILGLTSQEELEENSLWDYIEVKEESIIGSADYKNQEADLIQKDGTKLDILITTTSYDVDSTLIILQDVSEYKKTERMKLELEIQQEKLKTTLEYEELKTSFYINMSHEFKTPINIILGVIQLLQSENPPEKWDKYLSIAKQNSYRLWRLIDNLMDISKINAKAYEVVIAENNIVQIVEDMVLSVAEYMNRNNSGNHISITFDTDVEEKIIPFDPDLIERILLNLLSNAIKFSKENGNVLVNIQDGQEYITIIVEDDGIGIPEDQIPFIFRCFAKVDDSLTRRCEGSGIGLSIVYAFVKMQGGKIEVHSKANCGSKFIIQLPVGKQEKSGNEVKVLPIRSELISIEFSDIYS
ncbi:MASE3 domain-containing protein [Alkalibaculum bacchi]|uniref:sensor histidine kinase n=1 Tax=Alkalibaculum bacchi TaxID=645887 RepID=UPI0026F2DF14|nr:MASE3 domain-containing protein [Alkalibaculum bacchi]